MTAALHEWAVGVGEGRRELRVLPVGSLHVTLAFLGWQSTTAVERIAGVVRHSPENAPRLETAEAAWLPPRRPGVLAVDLRDLSGAAAELQADLSARLAANAQYEPEKRPWRAHVTAARVRRGARIRDKEVEDPPALAFAAPAVTLFRSHLQRSGAVYEAIARRLLGE